MAEVALLHPFAVSYEVCPWAFARVVLNQVVDPQALQEASLHLALDLLASFHRLPFHRLALSPISACGQHSARRW